jgi:predicted Zn-dependent protease
MIDLLAQQDRVEDAIKQDLELADLFKQMAQLDSARETLLAALMLSQRGRIDPKWAIQILEMMGDIDLSRLDVRQALEDFEQICELDPENEAARAHVIDLNLRLGQEKQAAEALDIHLDQLVKAGRGQDALTMIEELAREYPGKQALHSRLAEAYRAAGRQADAIAQYDALGEIQLDAGQVQEAIQTIQIIIDLDPPNIEDYEELIRNIQ